jgi:hypothetical protein
VVGGVKCIALEMMMMFPGSLGHPLGRVKKKIAPVEELTLEFVDLSRPRKLSMYLSNARVQHLNEGRSLLTHKPHFPILLNKKWRIHLLHYPKFVDLTLRRTENGDKNKKERAD